MTEKDVAEFKERGYWLGPKVIINHSLLNFYVYKGLFHLIHLFLKIIDDETIKLLHAETERVFNGTRNLIKCSHISINIKMM